MNTLNTLRTIRQEVRNSLKDLSIQSISHLDEKESNILQEVRTKGFHVIPDFYTAQEYEAARKEIDRLSIDYRGQMQSDALGSDHRIFGADRVSPLISKFYKNDFIEKIVTAHEKTKDVVGFTLAARLEYRPNNVGSGGGWHRDWAVNKQIKAMLYLTDVNEKNGPFQFFEGSHRPLAVIDDSFVYKFAFNQSRFTDEEIARMQQKKDPRKFHTLTGKAGTLVLVNTRGIHRGKPIEAGTRYALTNYYWSNMPIPDHIAKLIVK